MSVKLERPTSPEWHQEIGQFLSEALQRPCNVALLVPLTGSGLAHAFIKRIDGKPVAAQVWLTVPNPVAMAGVERICYRLCAVGEYQDEINTYRMAVFDTFPRGWKEASDD